MTAAEKKAYLNRYISAGREINDLERERERWRSRAERITPVYSDMPKGGDTSDRVGNAAVKIAYIDEIIGERIAALAALRLEIGRYIDTLEDDTMRRVLYFRYIEGLTWKKIAEKMNYSYQWVCILHGRALVRLK